MKIPERIGRYEIVDRLGSGGMGVVYRGRDPQIGRAVAIKLLHTADDKFRERFVQEARAAGNLRHPNIVGIYDVGEHDNQPYLVMELVDGHTLAEMIRSRSAQSTVRRLEIVEALAAALDYAHAQGVVHRDVKPANIMIDPEGVVKLLDFGIAHVVDSATTQVGTVMGSPNYMSPEQVMGRIVDRRSDIFAVGLILYEVLSYHQAFGGDPVSVMLAIVHNEPQPLLNLCPDLDPALVTIISKALEKTPERRYQSLGAMAVDLAAVRGRLSGLESSTGEWSSAADSRSIAPSPLPAREKGKPIDTPTEPDSQRSLPADTRAGLRQPAQTRRAAWLSLAKKWLWRVSDLFSAGPTPGPVSPPSQTSVDPETVDMGPAQPTVFNPRKAPVNHADIIRDDTVYLAPQSNVGLSDVPDVRLVIGRCPDPRRGGRTIEVTSVPFTLGRSTESDLAVGDPSWSRQQASIEFENASFTLRDHGSANGTYLNGRQVNGSEPLFFGATITIGDTVLTFTPGQGPTLPDLTGLEIAGRYQLQRLIRQSVKAAVYAAADRHVPRPIAIKLLAPGLMRYAGYREQFAREAETASRLQHPHICRVLDSGLTRVTIPDGAAIQTHFLCFELMAGGNLADRLEGKKSVGVDRIAAWIDALGGALDYAHRQGVVHGDLKPTSIVFDADGHLYLTDFAIAQKSLTAKGQPIIGSPAYIAPEQWNGGSITPATDQFAFAALAYYMIAGSKPFEGLDHPEVRAQHFRRGPEPAHATAARNGRVGVHQAVSVVLERALSVSPERRYPSVEQFARAVRRALAEGRRAGETPQVFISYDRELSGGWARYFADKLKDKHGIAVFMDTMGLDRAGRFPPRLATAIEECDVFVCFLAAATLNSKWVNEEIRLAHEHRKLMIPIFQESYVEESSESDSLAPVSELKAHQGIRLFDISGHYVDHAVSDLAAMVKGATALD